MRTLMNSATLSSLALLLASCGSAATGESPAVTATLAEGHAVEELARFDSPWAIALLPGDTEALVTERTGKLKLWREGGEIRDVTGVPQVDAGGQGGLGDVVLAPDFATSGMVYLTWAEAGEGDTRGAAMGRARLVREGKPRLEGLQVIWRQVPKVTGRGHFAHRIAFSSDGRYLFLSSGDRQKMAPAQDLSNTLGKVLRLLPDGSPAPGNPFADRTGPSAEIWSYGHRNVLGLQFDAAGRLWALEHGPKGGDELKLGRAGGNYGWPLVSDSDHYDGRPIPRNTTRPDLAAPAISWNPVIAPGDFLFYSGKAEAAWRGQAIIAGLVSQGLVRVAIDGGQAREVARIPLDARVRDVAEDANGNLWILTDREDGRLLRLTPRKK